MAYRQSNAAYDFELFEKKPLKSQPTLNVVKNQKYKKRDRMMVLRVVSSVAVVVAVICVMLYSRAELTALSYQIGQYEDTYQDLTNDYTRLSAEIESKISLRSVEESAKSLGLSKVETYQVKYLNLEGEDSVVIPMGGDEPETLSEKLSLYIQSFLEYIKIR